MNKKITKMLTVASAVAMPMMGAAPVLAQTTEIPKGTISVKGVDETDKATVTAYRIVEPTYGEHGVTGFKAIDGVTINDIEEPTSNEVQAIVAGIVGGTITPETSIELTGASDEYSGSAEAGMYLVLVTGSNATIYNPALVSLNLSDTNGKGTLSEEEVAVDMETPFAFGSVAYLKKTMPTLEKKIVDSSEGTDKGDTVAVGDDINFEITTILPSYNVSDNTDNGTVYKNLTYKIKDQLDESFAEITNVKVFLDDAELAAEGNYTVEMSANNKGFEIAFTKTFLSANGGKIVKVTYDTKLTEAASSKEFKDNLNTATLTYSNDPSDETGYGEFTEETHHYSFDFDLNKIDDEERPLSGAEFGLYKEQDLSDEPQKVTSDTNGLISFRGLDEGTYYVRELTAPEGYTLNDNTYKVVIEADLDPVTGELRDYSITINGDDMNEVTSEFVRGELGMSGEYGKVEIKNTRLVQMPSTGGVGTLLFTGAGATLFLGAGAAFSKARKMKKDN